MRINLSTSKRIKWHLWHGNVFRARQIGEDLEEDLDMLEAKNASIQKLLQAVREFNGYVTAKQAPKMVSNLYISWRCYNSIIAYFY